MEIKRIRSVMMIGLLMFSLIPGLFLSGVADLTEPNNDFANAETLAPGVAMTGTVDSATDTDDYYKFTVVNGQKISTKLEGTSIFEDIYGYLYQPDQTQITYTSAISTGQTDYINYTSSTTTAGDWYYRISDGTGDYSLTRRGQRDRCR